MHTFFRTLFFAGLIIAGISYLFSYEHVNETEQKKPDAREHKISKVEMPKAPTKPEPTKRVKKLSSLEKPSAVTSTPFAGIKSFGPDSGSGILSQSDQLASAAHSFSDSKSSQTTEVQILSKSEPQFPENAKKKNISGYVRLLITIDQSSTIKSVDVLEAKPEGYFESAAIDSIKSWKFAAAYLNGTPVEASIKRRIEFKLE